MTTLERTQTLEREIKNLERQLGAVRYELNKVRNECDHRWGKVVYDPEITEAYTVPGDPPGTMGIDRRFPCHVPRQETPKWFRTCTRCGLVQKTTKAQIVEDRVPLF